VGLGLSGLVGARVEGYEDAAEIEIGGMDGDLGYERPACLPARGKIREGEGAAPEDLQKLMATALSAARQGDQKKLKEIAQDLMIPEYEMWFEAMFGEEEGAKLGAAYRAYFDENEKWYPRLFEAMAKAEGEVIIEDVKTLPKRSESWCGQALANLQKADAVFYRVSVGMADSSGLRSGKVAGYFVLVGGTYRRLDCQQLGMRPPGSPTIGGPLHVGGNLQAARIIKKVPPVYPEIARANGVSGTVRLHVIIGRDGAIKQLEIVYGDPMLQQAAVDAVRQWQYQPTLLNGEPVEIDTTIDVIFSLARRP